MRSFIYTLSASAAATLLLIGCGTASDTSTATDITVERGPLLYASVTDADGQEAVMQGYGVYRFENLPVYPVTSSGGYIDMNRNNVVDEGDLNASALKLRTSQGTAATIVTTLAADNALKAMLQNEYNLSQTALFNATPSTDKTIAALSDEVYKYAVENNISDPSQITLQAMETLRTQIAARIEAYEASDLDAGELEQALVQNELSLKVMTQTEAENVETKMQRQSSSSSEDESSSSSVGQSSSSSADQSSSKNGSCDSSCSASSQSSDASEEHSSSANSSCESSCSSSSSQSSSDAELNDDQKYVLAYMWNEEKMAKDLYLALYEIWPNQVLYNIATKAETKHQAAIEALIESYDLNITDLDDYEEHYFATELDMFGPGEYSVSEVQELYDVLYSKGVQSTQDALEVGCMVEVTDVNDLNEDLLTVAGVDDLVTTLEYLRSGSYNHYWAFDSALKAMGVEDGCCILGDHYCKTEEEYPTTHSAGN